VPLLADRIADPDIGEAPQLRDLACLYRLGREGRTAAEYADPGNLCDLAGVADRAAVAQWLPDASGALEHPDVGDLFAGRTAFYLEHSAAATGVPGVDLVAGNRQQLGKPGGQRADARSGDRRAEVHRVYQCLPGLVRERGPEPPAGQRVLMGEVIGEQRVVAQREHVREAVRKARVSRVVRHPCGGSGPEVMRSPHGNDRRAEFGRDVG
jgi:hypothetical protein